MKKVLFAFAAIAITYSCSNDSDQAKDEDKNTDSSIVSPDGAEDTPSIDSVWNYYAGTVGIYDSQIIMELSFNGNKVNGNYWYTKHQKRIQIDGTIDSTANVITLHERVKGKITGHFRIEIGDYNNNHAYLTGSWYAPGKKSSTDQQDFFCERVSSENSAHMVPEFNNYVDNHKIESYNDEIDDFDFEDVSDDCSIVKIGPDKFLFIYNVIGPNYHTGSISGMGKLITPKLGQYFGDEECELMFKFYNDSIVIDDGDMTCKHYGGHRAYFGGTLMKVK